MVVVVMIAVYSKGIKDTSSMSVMVDKVIAPSFNITLNLIPHNFHVLSHNILHIKICLFSWSPLSLEMSSIFQTKYVSN